MPLRKMRVLKSIMGVALAAIIVLPAYVLLVLDPSFSRLLTRNTEDEAVRIANHLASTVIGSSGRPLGADTMTARTVQDVEQVRRDIGLVKVKLFSPQGQVVYSTDAREVGEINRHAYFQEVVAAGSPYTKRVTKDTRTLEGHLIAVDVVETYVPVMKDGAFLGAFEIYLDITESTEQMASLIRRATLIVLLMSGILVAALIVSYRRAQSDLAERERMEQALRKAARKFHDLYDNAPDMYYSLDAEGRVTDCNEAMLYMLGYERHEIVGTVIRDFFSERSQKLYDQFFPRLLEAEDSYFLEREYVRSDGRMFPASLHVFTRFDDQGRFESIRTIARDVTAEKEAEAKLRELAELDALTGIYNRRMFYHFLDAETNRAARYGRDLALIMFDIDHFKKINDTFGHDAGDEVLTGLVAEIQGKIRKADILARYGGEEFLLLSPETSAAGAQVLAEKIRSLAEAMNHGKVSWPVTISLGVTVFRSGEPPEDMVKRVDEALYIAKNSGRNRVEYLP